MSAVERRFVEFRAEGDAITGTVLRYGDVAKFGQYSERFEPGSLAWGDVIANIMHDRAKPVARTGAGLTLVDDGRAVTARIEPPDTPYGREARELIEARILRGLSMEFIAREDRYEGKERIVSLARLTGFGIVDRPAYPDSAIASRIAADRALRSDVRGRRRAV